MKEINLRLTNMDNECCLEGEFHQCCCKCSHHLKIFNHCCHSPEIMKDGCRCGEFLGFYVCTVFSKMDDMDRTAQISGEHSIGCECFSMTETKQDRYNERK